MEHWGSHAEAVGETISSDSPIHVHWRTPELLPFLANPKRVGIKHFAASNNLYFISNKGKGGNAPPL